MAPTYTHMCLRFPTHGGTGAIWKGVANLLPAKNQVLESV
jgi:hypothetical protein